MRPVFDRTVLFRLVIAILIVVPPLVFFVRQQANSERSDRLEQEQRIIRQNQADLARERVDRTVADCQAFNEERIAQIATSEALIRVAVSSQTTPLTARDVLLLEAFREKADRQIESVTRPKTCTIAALGLQTLEGIAQQAAPTTTTAAVPRAAVTSTTAHGVPQAARTASPVGHPKAPACAKVHGRCPPHKKG